MNWLIRMGIVCAAMGALATHGYTSEGMWILEDQRYLPGEDDACDTCGNFGGTANASVTSDGLTVHGVGYASDHSIGCSVRSIAVTTGVSDEFFIYYGPGQGSVLIYGQLFIRGVAKLENPECAAAALGYIKHQSNIVGEKVAVLRSSVAETSDALLGTVGAAYFGLGFSVPVNVGLGEGDYPDERVQTVFGYDCVDMFFNGASGRSYVHVFANAGIDDEGKARASLYGYSNLTINLRSCPCPPAVPQPSPSPIPGPGGGVTGGTNGGTTPPPGSRGGTTPRVPRPDGGCSGGDDDDDDDDNGGDDGSGGGAGDCGGGASEEDDEQGGDGEQ